MAHKIVWNPEFIDNETSRVRVIGGWLVRTIVKGDKGHIAVATSFLSDHAHQWNPISPLKEESPPAKSTVSEGF